MKSLGSCARSDAEDDGVVELRNTDALFVLVADLKKFSYVFAARKGNRPNYICCGW